MKTSRTRLARVGDVGLLIADTCECKALEFGANGVHQVGHAGEVPVGIGDLGMPEIGAQPDHREINGYLF